MALTAKTPLRPLEVAVEPKSEADQERLGVALCELAAADPSFTFKTDSESGQTILCGVSEQQIDLKIDALRRTYLVDANIGAPQVAYRETLGRKTEIDYTHKKQTGGSGQFARIKVVFEPSEPGKGYEFESKVVGGSVPKEFVPGVEKGLLQAKENGLLAGFPVIDFKATLVDGAYHDVDSSVLAFEIAARAAFRELREKASPKLLEPVMKVEVVTPAEYMGDVIGDLNSRRARILGTEQRGNDEVVMAQAPLGNMFGYWPQLRALTHGRARSTMRFYRYEPLPQIPPDDDPRFPPAIGMRA